MSNRLYLNQDQKLFVVLSYAGGTKYFRHLTETRLNTFVPVDGNSISPRQSSYNVVQIVREPMSRFISWFDKQYIKPRWKKTDQSLDQWINTLITTQWIDEFTERHQYFCHYDGHTNFQSIWPKAYLPSIWREDWQYLKMEDIKPYFLNESKFKIFRDPNEYIGVWDVLDRSKTKYFISKIENIYKPDIDWYNSLNFVKIS